jgi:hypothetical protein
MNGNPWARRAAAAAALATALVVAAWPDALVAAWQQLASFVAVKGEPIAASPAILSEHELDELLSLDPQGQAERLMERAINHYAGATDVIEGRVEGWVGKIALKGPLEGLYTTALNANDLRVRAAALEVYLAANSITKSEASLDATIARSDEGADGRAYFLWIVGVLGNRGVDPQRALGHLLRYLNDPDLQTRQWAVEGIAVLGTDDAIAPLLRVFHDDPSPFIRERAACGLAQSGMLTARQRWTAVPELIRFADDPGLDGQTRSWVFQALSDISGVRLGKDAALWREWWANGPHSLPEDAG